MPAEGRNETGLGENQTRELFLLKLLPFIALPVEPRSGS
jgi:hypothetical protein